MLRRAMQTAVWKAKNLGRTQVVKSENTGSWLAWVTQLLRQGDAKLFKKYSQMKLQMQREALQKLHRHANESASVLGTGGVAPKGFGTV